MERVAKTEGEQTKADNLQSMTSAATSNGKLETEEERTVVKVSPSDVEFDSSDGAEDDDDDEDYFDEREHKTDMMKYLLPDVAESDPNVKEEYGSESSDFDNEGYVIPTTRSGKGRKRKIVVTVKGKDNDAESKAAKIPKKRGRKKDPRRLDGREDVTSEEEEDEGDIPVRFGTGYHVLYKRKVLKYASTHSNSATAEKFGIAPKLIREWRKQREKIEEQCVNPPPKRPRNDCYTVEEKLQAIKFAAERSTDEARLLYNVDRRTIEKWRAMKDRLEARANSGQGNAIREAGSGRPLQYKHIEDTLRDWIVGLRLRQVTVNSRMILAKAKKLIEESNTEGKELKVPASDCWVASFLKRHNLHQLTGTTLGREDPREILRVDLITNEQDAASLANKIDEIPENPNKRNRRTITLQDKLKIIERIQNGGESQGAVAKSLKVATSTIQTIWSCRKDILIRSQRQSAKQKSPLFWRKYSVIAAALQDWYDQTKSNPMTVNAKSLLEKAIQLSETYRLPEFRNESGEWLRLFCKRRNLKSVLKELQDSRSGSAHYAFKSHSQIISEQSANPSSSIPTDSCKTDEMDSFSLDDFVTYTPNASVSSLHSVAGVRRSSGHQQIQPVASHPTITNNYSTSNSQVIFTGEPAPLYSLTSPVTSAEAMKCVNLLRSWVTSNYGSNEIDLNAHLSIVENAILKKKPY